ncbi:hypothetical protein Acsp05_01570 [Actinokineospora sp. NBRC 105648]|nr:hypothetical protein Acsp05_01570 [Actinokineospora sp. NBRC 105648]
MLPGYCGTFGAAGLGLPMLIEDSSLSSVARIRVVRARFPFWAKGFAPGRALVVSGAAATASTPRRSRTHPLRAGT